MRQVRRSIFTRIVQALLGKPLELILRPYFEVLLMSISTLHLRLMELQAQLDKVHDEIITKIEELRLALENAEQVPPEVNEILDAIQARVDSLDAIVPDAEPEPEPGE